MAHDQYQTVKEVADRLLVCEATVRHWIKDGDLRAIEVGKGWRIADSDLNAFLHKHATCDRLDEVPHEERDDSTLPDKSKST